MVKIQEDFYTYLISERVDKALVLTNPLTWVILVVKLIYIIIYELLSWIGLTDYYLLLFKLNRLDKKELEFIVQYTCTEKRMKKLHFFKRYIDRKINAKAREIIEINKL